MTSSTDRMKKALSARPDDAKYDVGYRKPPEKSRFKPGQSGNPKGRPRGSKNKVPALNEERLKEIVLKEAYRKIRVNEGDKAVKVPVAEAVFRSIALNAAKGNVRAQRHFTDMLSTTEEANKRLHNELLERAITYKSEWERELERCRELGIDPPEPVPDPDDIVIDFNTGTVQIKGPWTKEEKFEYDWWRNRKEVWEQEIPKLKRELESERDPTIRRMIKDDIRTGEDLLDMLRIIFPDPDPRIAIMERAKRSKRSR